MSRPLWILELGAKISREFVCREQLSRPDLGHQHHIRGLFYEADLPEWDMILGFSLLDIAHARVLSAGAPCSSRELTSSAG